ncbi:MAG: sulfatase/phosphatase domain-containing protein, partial [Chryseolinea sp.]
QVGKLLKDLEDAGLADNTIVFYYADNGGVLPRSKRFLFESGLHVPLIVRVPEKYKKFIPNSSGQTTDRLVTFLDFAPTVLNVAGIKPPDYMQGGAFLGENPAPAPQYAYGFRGRMDERIDLSRTVRDKKYRYIRNYLPHLSHGQHLQYLWLAASTRSWEEEFKSGRLNDVQSAFWRPKPAEELYDVTTDPDNVNNLAGQSGYDSVLLRLGKANTQWLIKTRDIGFIPEGVLWEMSAYKGSLLEMGPKENVLERIIETADLASMRDPKNVSILTKRLTDNDPAVRYWAAIGCTVMPNEMAGAESRLASLLEDPEGAVHVAAAEALYHMGQKEEGLKGLIEELKSQNVFVKVQCINVLQSLGNDALPALDAVKKLIPPVTLPSTKHEETYDLKAARSFVKEFDERQ